MEKGTKAKRVLNHHTKSLANIAKLTTAKKLVKKNHKYSKNKLAGTEKGKIYKGTKSPRNASNLANIAKVARN